MVVREEVLASLFTALGLLQLAVGGFVVQQSGQRPPRLREWLATASFSTGSTQISKPISPLAQHSYNTQRDCRCQASFLRSY